MNDFITNKSKLTQKDLELIEQFKQGLKDLKKGKVIEC